jgi:hypothetical protein
MYNDNGQSVWQRLIPLFAGMYEDRNKQHDQREFQDIQGFTICLSIT